MVIERVEQFGDRIRVHLHFHNGMHIPDEHSTVELLYADIPSLPPPPEFQEWEESSGGIETNWAERVQVPAVGKTVAYHFSEWQETTSSRMQRLTGGPYLVANEPAGSVASGAKSSHRQQGAARLPSPRPCSGSRERDTRDECLQRGAKDPF